MIIRPVFDRSSRTDQWKQRHAIIHLFSIAFFWFLITSLVATSMETQHCHSGREREREREWEKSPNSAILCQQWNGIKRSSHLHSFIPCAERVSRKKGVSHLLSTLSRVIVDEFTRWKKRCLFSTRDSSESVDKYRAFIPVCQQDYWDKRFLPDCYHRLDRRVERRRARGEENICWRWLAWMKTRSNTIAARASAIDLERDARTSEKFKRGWTGWCAATRAEKRKEKCLSLSHVFSFCLSVV